MTYLVVPNQGLQPVIPFLVYKQFTKFGVWNVNAVVEVYYSVNINLGAKRHPFRQLTAL